MISTVSRSTFIRCGPRVPIGGGKSVGSRTIEARPSTLTILVIVWACGTTPRAGCARNTSVRTGTAAWSEAVAGGNKLATATIPSPRKASPVPNSTRSFLSLGRRMVFTAFKEVAASQPDWSRRRTKTPAAAMEAGDLLDVWIRGAWRGRSAHRVTTHPLQNSSTH